MATLADIIRPIVEGQVKAWQDAHPYGEEYPGHLISGVGKRVTHDICSAQTVERIRLALSGAGLCSGAAGHDDAAEGSTAASTTEFPPVVLGGSGSSPPAAALAARMREAAHAASLAAPDQWWVGYAMAMRRAADELERLL